MIGLFYIDGINAYETYNVFVKKDSFLGLVKYPEFKDITINNWLESDGIEVDLSDPVFKSKTFSITFISDKVGFCNFMQYITETVYHDFYFPALDKTFKLRAVKQSSNLIETLQFYEVEFVDDFPMSDYSYVAPIPTNTQTFYYIDDSDLKNYGLQILNGTNESIFFQPEIKEHVYSDTPTSKGILYGSQKLEFVAIGDDAPETILPENYFKSKEGILHCLLICPDISIFWQNYNAFIYDLTRPNERILKSDCIGGGTPFYYNGVTINNFLLTNGEVWCDFSVSLVQTGFRLEETYLLLATEDNYLVQTEDGINYIQL